jgi:conjugal transfer pilus assembly protein TraF
VIKNRNWLAFAFTCLSALYALEANAERAFFGVSDEREPSSITDGSAFYEEKEKGWFWYEDNSEEPDESNIGPPQKAPPVKETKTEQKVVKQADSKPLSAEWFRKNMDTYRDKAVDEPTGQNVAAYLYLQRVMLDKAEKFSEVAQQVVMSDAVLDENSRRPIASFGGSAMDDMATRGTDKAAKKLAGKAGLWFFYSSTCEFCIKEAGAIKGLMSTFGFKVVPIAIDGLPLPGGDFPEFTSDHGQAKSLGVETTPALFLVKPGQGGGAIQIGQGLLANDEIIKRAISLGHQNGWIDDNAYNDTLTVKPLRVDTTTLPNLGDKIMENPNELVNTIRNNLKKQL